MMGMIVLFYGVQVKCCYAESLKEHRGIPQNGVLSGPVCARTQVNTQALDFSDFLTPLWRPRLAKTCERERRPTPGTSSFDLAI